MPDTHHSSELRIDEGVRQAIRNVPHFNDSQYVGLDIEATIDYFRRKFVDKVLSPALTPDDVVADVGCGYGWLAFALATYSPSHIIAVDMDELRLDAAKRIAAILGIGDRIEWRVGSLQNIPLTDQEADLTFCIEVLEHIQRDVAGLRELARITRNFLVLTTPNGAFPVISHDTCLPFCHWLPMRLRDVYAGAMGRLNMQQGNRFWTPFDLSRHLSDFLRVSRFLHYRSVEDVFDLYPYYLPYGRGEWRLTPSLSLKAYYRMVAHFGKASQFFLPSLAGTFQRQTKT
jgi:2-polyprenyl-3-methyl-5-hydroxy-6-metoxy-1,4-benzoquinol methylase